MKIKFRSLEKGNDSRTAWNEEVDTEACRKVSFVKGESTPMEYAQTLIDYFNNTLHEGEKERELLGATEII